MDAYAMVRRAIAERLQVHALVDGRPRQLCPHVLGYRDGVARALFFQFAGYSESGLAPGGDWRCIDLDRLSDLTLHDGEWRTAAHSQPQGCVAEVDLAVGD